MKEDKKIEKLTPEQLLRVRYKVIADYPNAEYRVGNIIEMFEHLGESWSFDDSLSPIEPESFYIKYPHLFKPLAWYEERKEKDMPEYVKHIKVGVPIRINSILELSEGVFDVIDEKNEKKIRHFSRYLPATQSEYEDYLTNKH